MPSIVSRIPAAPSSEANRHFQNLLRFETDCWDTHFAIINNKQDFVLFDVRSAEMFSQGHLPNAENLPHKRINHESLAKYPMETLFVVYCSGPHCNGADRAALKLAELGRPVKKMIGGVTGWLDEGFDLVD